MSGTAPGTDRPAACLNCGAALAGIDPAPRFCPACGQETIPGGTPFAEAARAALRRYAATLGLLLRHPGRLTTETLAGRRQRYVPPLRLYMAASALCFFVFKLIPALPAVHTAPATVAAGPAASAASAVPGERVTDVKVGVTRIRVTGGAASDADRVDRAACAARSATRDPCNAFERRTERMRQRWQADPAGAAAAFQANWLAVAPYSIFLLLPVFAAIVMLLQRASGRPFGAHAVFALHMHAFWCLAAIVVGALPDGLDNLVMLPVVAYGVAALREVYGGSWPRAIARGLVISLLYGVVVVITSAVLALAVAMAS